MTRKQIIKRLYDSKAVARAFRPPGGKVLALEPILGSPIGAKYSGPLTVLRKIFESNNVVSTPEHRRKKTTLSGSPQQSQAFYRVISNSLSLSIVLSPTV